jgi:hypothetical protein
VEELAAWVREKLGVVHAALNALKDMVRPTASVASSVSSGQKELIDSVKEHLESRCGLLEAHVSQQFGKVSEKLNELEMEISGRKLAEVESCSSSLETQITSTVLPDVAEETDNGDSSEQQTDAEALLERRCSQLEADVASIRSPDFFAKVTEKVGDHFSKAVDAAETRMRAQAKATSVEASCASFRTLEETRQEMSSQMNEAIEAAEQRMASQAKASNAQARDAASEALEDAKQHMSSQITEAAAALEQ